MAERFTIDFRNLLRQRVLAKEDDAGRIHPRPAFRSDYVVCEAPGQADVQLVGRQNRPVFQGTQSR